MEMLGAPINDGQLNLAPVHVCGLPSPWPFLLPPPSPPPSASFDAPQQHRKAPPTGLKLADELADTDPGLDAAAAGDGDGGGDGPAPSSSAASLAAGSEAAQGAAPVVSAPGASSELLAATAPQEAADLVLPAAAAAGGLLASATSEEASAAALEHAYRTTADEARSNVLQKDAFLVFRALCKLSIRTSDTVTAQDPTAVR